MIPSASWVPPPRWPTIGLKLSALPEPSGFTVRHPVDGPFSYLNAILNTAVNSWDQRHLEDPAILARTVFVDTSDVPTLEFSLPPRLRHELVDRGRAAARDWLDGQRRIRAADPERLATCGAR